MLQSLTAGSKVVTGVPGRTGQDVMIDENLVRRTVLPAWLPEAVRLYLDHTENGVSLRALARREGCHASTVMRQVRRYENRRDDPLVDEALQAFGGHQAKAAAQPKEKKDEIRMTAALRMPERAVDDAMLQTEALRILRRLDEPGSVLIIATDMEKAAVLRVGAEGAMVQVAVLDRGVAQGFALKEWIACQKAGRVSSYVLTPAGRLAVRRMAERARGFAEAQSPFSGAHRDWDADLDEEDGRRRLRYNAAESPVQVLGRRVDKDGQLFLSADLVRAAERLREDFELAQMGARSPQNWEECLTGRARSGARTEGPRAARDRVAMALRDLGPGLGDVALRCCCYLEGLETAEKRLGWAARSGKVVLRIALQQLKQHYEAEYGLAGQLIG